MIGEITAPTAVLIRPDGYVAWVQDSTDVRLTDALTTWFGVDLAADRLADQPRLRRPCLLAATRLAAASGCHPLEATGGTVRRDDTRAVVAVGWRDRVGRRRARSFVKERLDCERPATVAVSFEQMSSRVDRRCWWRPLILRPR